MAADASEQGESGRSTEVARRNAAQAHLAIRHVRSQLPPFDRAHPAPRTATVGAADFGAWLTGRGAQIWPLRHEAERAADDDTDRTSAVLVHRLADAARRAGAGRAGDEAVLAFAYLHALGVRPLDFMCCPGREHAFVVIGCKPPKAGSRLRPEDWGAEAVVCDPFQGVVYTQPELLTSEQYDDYHPCESQLCVPAERAAEVG